MDQELKAYLDNMREGLEQKIGSVREEVGSVRQEVGSVREEVGSLREEVGSLREEVGSVRQEVSSVREEVGSVRQDMDIMQESLVRKMVDLNMETRAEAREHSERLHMEARVLIEDVGKKVGLVWEGVLAIKETLDSNLDDHEQRIQSLERKAL